MALSADAAEAAQGRLRELIAILAEIGLHAEHTPDGWMVIDERAESALEMPV